MPCSSDNVAAGALTPSALQVCCIGGLNLQPVCATSSARHGAPASGFVPGAVAEAHGAAVRESAAAGHEPGVSGYRREDFDPTELGVAFAWRKNARICRVGHRR